MRSRLRYGCVLVLAVVAAGCGVKAQTYVMTKERVDIAPTAGGNAGYLSGSPQYQEPERKSRKIYILEVSKPVSEKDIRKVQQETIVRENRQAVTEVSPDYASDNGSRRVILPRIDDEPMSAAGPTEDVLYTVEKDDTLQKIANKFYGSYGTWVRIYEANKDKINNPNFVRPGTVLTIPAVEQ